MKALTDLFERTFGCRAGSCLEIPASGSYRRYFRLSPEGGTKGVPVSVIGCWNADKKENGAFVSFARAFRAEGLPVPEIYGVDEEKEVYLQQDLGGESLFDRVSRLWLPEMDKPFPAELMTLYRKVLMQLTALQLKGRTCIDYSKCTPCPAFHRDAIHWDLNYFKYFFLKLMRVPFDEQALEDDFRTFSAYLLEASHDFFLYRDFQSANVMIPDGEPYFIDFQGGRRGALQYDVASLLFDAKTQLPKTVRDELTEEYYEMLRQVMPTICPDECALSKDAFMSYFQGYTLCRLMQALAAFGLRGVVEHKPGFRESIPPALRMVRELSDDWQIPVRLPELQACLDRIQQL